MNDDSDAGVNRLLVDNFQSADLISLCGTTWRGVSDRVMGGVSQAHITHDEIEVRGCLRLTGAVSLDNNGGFIQATLDLTGDAGVLDASSYSGVYLEVLGNAERYAVHLRTPDNVRPWQSYRASFVTTTHWKEVRLPFASFVPHRLSAPLDIRRLRRLGLVAIGRAFEADLAVAALGFYRSVPGTGTAHDGKGTQA